MNSEVFWQRDISFLSLHYGSTAESEGEEHLDSCLPFLYAWFEGARGDDVEDFS